MPTKKPTYINKEGFIKAVEDSNYFGSKELAAQIEEVAELLTDEEFFDVKPIKELMQALYGKNGWRWGLRREKKIKIFNKVVDYKLKDGEWRELLLPQIEKKRDEIAKEGRTAGENSEGSGDKKASKKDERRFQFTGFNYKGTTINGGVTLDGCVVLSIGNRGEYTSNKMSEEQVEKLCEQGFFKKMITKIAEATKDELSDSDFSRAIIKTINQAAEAQSKTYEAFGQSIESYLNDIKDGIVDIKKDINDIKIKLDKIIRAIVEKEVNNESTAQSTQNKGEPKWKTAPPWISVVAVPAIIGAGVGLVVDATVDETTSDTSNETELDSNDEIDSDTEIKPTPDNDDTPMADMDDNDDGDNDEELEVDANGFKYGLLPDKTWAVSAGEGFMGGVLVIPSTYQGRQVTAISDNGFNNQTMAELLTSITIPEGIKKIGNNAFAGSGLTKVTIPSTVEVIGEYAFAQSDKLEKVTINGAATTLGDHCFAECGALTTISLGANVSALGNEVFSGCPVLKTVNYGGTLEQWSLLSKADNWDADTQTIDILCSDSGTDKDEQYTYVLLEDDTYSVQAGLNFVAGDVEISGTFNGKAVAAIAQEAFKNRADITSVRIPGSVTSIKRDAFLSCDGLIEVYFKGDVNNWLAINMESEQSDPMCVAETLHIENMPEDGAITIQDGLTEIRSNALKGLQGVTSIDVPNSVKRIGINAFHGCNVTEITIPFVGHNADGSGEVHFGYIFGASSANSNGKYVPDSLKVVNVTDGEKIGESAFFGCVNLTSITIPDDITSIGEMAFYNSGLTNFVIPNGVKEVAYATFGHCKNLIEVTVPNGVTRIGDSAFADSGLKGIDMPNSVTEMGISVFYACHDLVDVKVSECLENIGDMAFAYCDKLDEIIIPNSVKTIDQNAFSECNALNSITVPFVGEKADGTGAKHIGYWFGTPSNINRGNVLPQSLKEVIITGGTSISEDSFWGCQYIERIVIPSSVTTIEDRAFHDCVAVTGIVIPNSVTTIGKYAFAGCRAMESLVIGNHVESIDDGAFELCSKITEIEIPSSVKYIGVHSFLNCGGVRKLTINPGVETIGSSAFGGLSEITEITIPDTVKRMGEEVLEGCSGLTEMTIPFVGEEVKTADETYQYPFGYIFGHSPSTGDIEIRQGYHEFSTNGVYYGSYTLPTNLRSVTITGGNILRGAFSDCGSLTSITIPDGTTCIGEEAFLGCSGLSSITIPEGIKMIGNNAFAGSGLTKVTIPSTVEVIGEYAFAQSDKLEKVTINGAATTLGDHCFAECGALTTISLGANVSALGNEVFSGCPVLKTVNYGGTLEQWSLLSKADNWDADTQTIDILCSDSGTDKDEQYTYVLLEDDTYSVQAGLNFVAGDVEISGTFNGKAVAAIAQEAFKNRADITSVRIPDSVEYIGENAFTGCDAMTSITIPFVGEKADGSGYTNFDYLFGGKLVIGGEGDDFIASHRGGRIPSTLKEVIINGGETIGEYAFWVCDGVTSITILDGVTSIGDDAFYGCSGLTSITIPDSVTSIGEHAFVNCSSLTSITIPDSVTSIGEDAFYRCSSLTSITIPDRVTSIGSYAFYGCSGLTTINFQGTKAQWQAIERGINWDRYTGGYAVICTDGTISKADA